MLPADLWMPFTVRRTACIDVNPFPLQLLLRRHPDWHNCPVAVVSNNDPLGIVSSINQLAFTSGVRIGMCYSTALSLAPYLQASTIGAKEIAVGAKLIHDLLLSISPFVEGAGVKTNSHTSYTEPGVFWLDASGLQRHYSSPETLAQTIRCRLGKLLLDAKIVIGYTRFGTHMLTSDAHCGWLVMDDAAAESIAARRAPLGRLPLDAQEHELLERLDITTVDAFLQLPYAEILRRLGEKTAAIYRSACSDLEMPVQGDIPASPFLCRTLLPDTETDARSLQQHIKIMLAPLLDRLRTEGQSVEELSLQLMLEDSSHHYESIRPAAPTCEQQVLFNLISLRLESIGLSAGVEEISIDAIHVPAHVNQMTLFRTPKGRDPSAGDKALARIRAQFGNNSVMHAVLDDKHLPEAQFHWKPVAKVMLPQPNMDCTQENKTVRWLVRRILKKPTQVPIPKSPLQGPHLISGGWWHAHGNNLPGGVNRAYYIVLSPNDTLEWVYQDRITDSWHLQGWVE